MAWHTQLLSPLRVIVNDIDGTEYSDETMYKLLVTAGMIVAQECELNNSYTFDFATPEISPDPSTDDAFLALVVMKAACLSNQWEHRKRAIIDGIKARCGPAQMDVRAGSGIIEQLMTEGPCKTYEEMKLQNNLGNTAIFRAVLSPFAHADVNFGGVKNDRYI